MHACEVSFTIIREVLSKLKQGRGFGRHTKKGEKQWIGKARHSSEKWRVFGCVPYTLSIPY
jgi:hypothetical protein